MLAFVEGRDLPERSAVAQHLTACDECRQVVALLSSSRDGSAVGAFAPAAGLIEPGVVIGNKYEIVAIIGRGGMGIVVEALHRTLRQRVALKFLVGPLARDPAHVARFFREARAAATLGSEHVVRVLDADWLPTGEPFIALELLEGRDLAAELRARGPLPIGEAVAYVLDACEALALAHKHGIVHRDIKPANLFLTRSVDGAALVKVLDFGIAKVHAQSDTASTDPSAIVGSPRYMAPEQVRGGKGVDARADVWALGVTLFELVSGRVPFDGENLLEICAAIITGAPPSLVALRPDAPPGLADALLRALQRDAEGRTPSVLAFAEQIAPFAPLASAAGLERLRRIANATPSLEPIPSSRPALSAAAAQLGSDSTVAASLAPRAEPTKKSQIYVAMGAVLAVLTVTLVIARPWRSETTTTESSVVVPARPVSESATPRGEQSVVVDGAREVVSASASAPVPSASATSSQRVARTPAAPAATVAVVESAATARPADPPPPPKPTASGNALHRDGLLDRK
jgi:eukaryotic-like serine/threonine-protein kinase